MDPLTAFGAVSVTAMLVCYALEARDPGFVLAFAFACWCSALYGWLAGTWPFAVIELVWGVVAMRRFGLRLQARRRSRPTP